jgi:tetratricopeptide (TPR) repeat protein
MGQAQSAINMLTAAKKENADSAWPGIALAAVYINEGLNDEAAVELKQALSAQPQNLEAQKLLAVLNLKTKNFATAIDGYAETIRKTPYDLDAYMDLASAQQKIDNPIGAITSLRRATEIAPTCAIAHASLSNALEAIGESREAEYEARLALRLNPNQQIAGSTLQRMMH